MVGDVVAAQRAAIVDPNLELVPVPFDATKPTAKNRLKARRLGAASRPPRLHRLGWSRTNSCRQQPVPVGWLGRVGRPNVGVLAVDAHPMGEERVALVRTNSLFQPVVPWVEAQICFPAPWCKQELVCYHWLPWSEPLSHGAGGGDILLQGRQGGCAVQNHRRSVFNQQHRLAG